MLAKKKATEGYRMVNKALKWEMITMEERGIDWVVRL